MAAILDSILKIIAFPMWIFVIDWLIFIDFFFFFFFFFWGGGILICYLWYQILPKSVEKPFVAICWGLNCRLTRLPYNGH